ncbi:MAG: adenylyl-sulfate kinase [Caldilineaceae bacterium]
MTSQTGFALWFTGLPASGKSTLAAGVAAQLHKRGISVQILDSDELRQVLTPNPTYTLTERDWFYGVMAYMGQLLTKNGVNVIFAATANRRYHRDRARAFIPRFAEVYVHCPPERLRERDPKGIYALAAAGDAPHVPGIGEPYEAPLQPAVTVDTEQQHVDEAVAAIVAYIEATLTPANDSHPEKDSCLS